MTHPRLHRSWVITWDYGEWSAIGPNYDCDWQGEEDGWVSNGEQVFSKTYDGLIQEIDDWIEQTEIGLRLMAKGNAK